MEPVSEQPKKVRAAPAQDRVTLGKVEAVKVEGWTRKVNEASKGFLSLSKSDMINALVRMHPEELTPKEIQRMRADHYDPIRHITWITPQIKAALSSGDMIRVAELQEELRGVELSVVKDAIANPGGGAALEGKSSARRRKSQLQTQSKSMPEDAEQAVRLEENRASQSE